jgi:hypothetical protein
MVRLSPKFWKAEMRAIFSGCGEVKVDYENNNDWFH